MNGDFVKNEILDIDELMIIVDHNKELLIDCFDLYLSNYSDALIKMNEAIVNNNSQDLARSAHKFKSTMKYLAAHECAEICSKLEVMGKEESLKEAHQSLDELSAKCNEIKIFIENNYK